MSGVENTEERQRKHANDDMNNASPEPRSKNREDETDAEEDTESVLEEEGERTSGGPRNTTASEPGQETDSTTVPQRQEMYTARFTGFVLLFAGLVILGILTFHPAAIAAAGALLTFLVASLVQTPTNPGEHLTTSYSVTPQHPRPAESVEVEITVRNDSDKTFTDLRLIDTVPDDLRVTGGTPRAAEALRPGETITISYTVTAKRGTYSFGPVIARTRTLMGSMWIQEPLPINTTERIRCAVRADDIPLDEQATHFIGGLLGESAGDGIEFYATREYHRGDPPSKINWRELGKRGELSTITYREQQAADVTIIPDARIWSRVSAGPGTPSASVLSLYAAYQLTSTLINQGHYVGMVVPGVPPVDAAQQAGHGFPYRRFEHGRGTEQQQRAFEILDNIEDLVMETTYDAGDTAPLRDLGAGGFQGGRDANGVFDVNPYQVPIRDFVHDLTAWANPNTQFIFITPLLDDGAHGFCTQLQNRGDSVVVISPDVTKKPEDSGNGKTAREYSSDPLPEGSIPVQELQDVSRRVLSVQRGTRIESLRRKGLTVIDWDPEEPLAVCCERQTLPRNG